MAKSDLASTTTEVHALLKDLESADRHKVIQAAMTLLDDSFVVSRPGGGSGNGHAGGGAAAGSRAALHEGIGTAAEFFALKEPRNKVEELAVAARHRELTISAESHSKDELAATIKAARRNFDAAHFRRDLTNAKTSKMFNLGKDNALSYAGQQFVDALPDREQASAARSRRGKKKKSNIAKANS